MKFSWATSFLKSKVATDIELGLDSLIKLIKTLMKKYKIKKKNILGHSDIAPLRKLDPGEKFPWNYLSKKGAAIWYPKNKLKTFDTNLKNMRKIHSLLFFLVVYSHSSLSSYPWLDSMDPENGYIKSGQRLMNLEYGLSPLEVINKNEKVAVIGVHGRRSEGY